MRGSELLPLSCVCYFSGQCAKQVHAYTRLYMRQIVSLRIWFSYLWRAYWILQISYIVYIADMIAYETNSWLFIADYETNSW